MWVAHPPAPDASAATRRRRGRHVRGDDRPLSVAATSHKDMHAPDPVDPFRDANDLIEEIARRFEADGGDWLDPGILAAVAATVP